MDFNTTFEDLICADDIALFLSTWSHMQKKTSRLKRNATYVGLKMGAKKTKVMSINLHLHLHLFILQNPNGY